MGRYDRAKAAVRQSSRHVELAEPGNGKRCNGCTRYLTRSSFHRNAASADGRQTICKDCGHRSNSTGRPVASNVVFADQPLKRAHYETVIVNGREMLKYVIA